MTNIDTDKHLLPRTFIDKIALCLQEEDVDVYVLNLYYRNSEDLDYFDVKDRKRVKRIFDILIRDTKSHMELLKLIVDMGKQV